MPDNPMRARFLSPRCRVGKLPAKQQDKYSDTFDSTTDRAASALVRFVRTAVIQSRFRCCPAANDCFEPKADLSRRFSISR